MRLDGQISKVGRNYLNEEVYKILKEAILSGKLKSGERIIEVSLASSMQISRTPLREALNKLKSEGMVCYNRNNKLVVSKLSMKELDDLFGVRVALECYGARLACEIITREDMERLWNNIQTTHTANEKKDYKKIVKLNREFHDIIARSSCNDRLVTMLNSLKEQIDRYRRMVIWNVEEAERSLNGHIAIYEALKKKDVEHITSISEYYINLAKEGVLKRISNYDLLKK
ncbi:MAG: GntR family transcriptional regulator [Candidatus Humimicrobiaceae bacterium]